MSQRDWYLLAYDIRAPHRLRRVHHYLRKRGLATQQSVFFLHASETELTAALDDLAALMNGREDDLRAYPIHHPAQVWLSGQSVVAGPLLQPPERTIGQRPAAPAVEQQGIRGLLGRLWRKNHDR
jgi:CRISPR-associated endonuclease Cas2